MVCNEDKLETLLADLAAHKLDMVISDGPMLAGTSVKAYHHALATGGVTFFGSAALAARYEGSFPQRLQQAPMLMPTEASILRGEITRWLQQQGITPHIIAEFQDTALLKAFGQAGVGFFHGPSMIEDEIIRQHQVVRIGRTDALQANYFAITTERRLSHPAAQAIQQHRDDTLHAPTED